jgi:recombination protein RecA
MGVLEKSGAWYSFKGERIGQGRESAKEFLRAHPETAKEISEKILTKAGLKRAGVETPPQAAPQRDKPRAR